MNDDFTQWLDARAFMPGMLACAAGLAERGTISRSFSPACPGEKMEAILNQLAATLASLTELGLDAQVLNWTFEQGHIRLVSRPDGAVLALAVGADTDAARNLEVLAAEFLALNLGI